MSHAASDILTVQLQYTISGNRLSSTFHFACASSVQSTDPANLGSGFAGTRVPQVAAVVSSEVKFEAVYVTALLQNVANPYTQYLQAVVGLQVGESIPSNLAAVFQLRQLETASKHNGRIYVSGIPEDKVESSLITQAFLTGAMQTLSGQLAAAIVAGGQTYTPVVVQRVEAGIQIAPLGYDIAQVVPTRSLGSQRRRTTELRQIHP